MVTTIFTNITNLYNIPANICWSRRHETVTILCLPRRLEDVLEDKKLLDWRRLGDVLETCLADVLKTCLEDMS